MQYASQGHVAQMKQEYTEFETFELQQQRVTKPIAVAINRIMVLHMHSTSL